MSKVADADTADRIVEVRRICGELVGVYHRWEPPLTDVQAKAIEEWYEDSDNTCYDVLLAQMLYEDRNYWRERAKEEKS